MEAPSAHLKALLTRLGPWADEIAAVAAMPSTHSVRVYVVEHRETDNFWTGVDAQELAAIVAMGADLFFDIYFYGDADDE